MNNKTWTTSTADSTMDTMSSDSLSTESDYQQRRPPNAFILFSRSVRPKVQRSNPGMTNIEHTKIMAKMWKEMSENKKSEFKKKAAHLQNEFKAKNPHYAYKKCDKKKKRNMDKKTTIISSIFPESTLQIKWEELATELSESKPNIQRNCNVPQSMTNIFDGFSSSDDII